MPPPRKGQQAAKKREEFRAEKAGTWGLNVRKKIQSLRCLTGTNCIVYNTHHSTRSRLYAVVKGSYSINTWDSWFVVAFSFSLQKDGVGTAKKEHDPTSSKEKQ